MVTLQELKEKYPCIVKWGKRMGSYDYYIQGELQKAYSMNAPATAIYEREGIWQVAENIRDKNLRKQILG